MKRIAGVGLFILMVWGTACSKQGNNSTPINVGSCGNTQAPNIACVDVTVCSPGTSNCQVVHDVLLDTGSYGLRVFGSLLTVKVQPQTGPSGATIAECSPFAQGTSDWGPVMIADVGIAGETAPSVPIQVIDSSFSSIPPDCTNPDTDPQSAGFNGILGVGPIKADCGPNCASDANNRVYFACGSAGCQGVALPVQEQVANPVYYFPSDNNGLVITIPAVPPGGVASVVGTLTLGIGTQSNNTPAKVSVIPADSNGNFVTVFQGASYNQSTIDSGSNGLFLPTVSGIPECENNGGAAGFFCPSSLVSLSAIQKAASGSEQVVFQLLNADQALSSSNRVFSDLGGTGLGDFYWGFPFFTGKTVYVGLEGASSPLGSGPYWAY